MSRVAFSLCCLVAFVSCATVIVPSEKKQKITNDSSDYCVPGEIKTFSKKVYICMEAIAKARAEEYCAVYFTARSCSGGWCSEKSECLATDVRIEIDIVNLDPNCRKCLVDANLHKIKRIFKKRSENRQEMKLSFWVPYSVECQSQFGKPMID